MPPPYVEAMNYSVDVFGVRKQLMLNGVIMVGPYPIGLETPENSSLLPHIPMLGKRPFEKSSKKAAIYQSGRELLLETKPCQNLILDFFTFRTERK